LQDPPKFTQIGIFGLKIYHLATLHLIRPVFVTFLGWSIFFATCGKNQVDLFAFNSGLGN
jgi:hypothetical protein